MNDDECFIMSVAAVNYIIHDSEYYNNIIRCTDRWFWRGSSCRGSAPGAAETNRQGRGCSFVNNNNILI